MPWNRNNTPTIAERIVAGFSYLTLGLIGLLYIIFTGNRNQSSFFRFHFIQSILIGILAILLNFTSNILVTMLSALMQMFTPLLGGATNSVSYWLVYTVQIVINAFKLLVIYGMLWAFCGKFAEIPYISNMVRRQM